MKCAEFQEQAGAYALDALDDDERRACERHLGEEGPHEGCEEQVARYQRGLDRLGDVLPAVPVRDAVWDAIACRLGVHRAPARGRRLAATLGWAVAAVALLAALFVRQDAREARDQQRETNVALTQGADALTRANAARAECTQLLERATQSGALARDAVALLDDQATRITPMAPSDDRPFRATTLYSPSRKRALAVSSALAPIAGKDYALWVIAGSAPPQPAGFIRFDAQGVAVGEFDPRLLADAAPSALAISLEEPGGASAPTDVILVARL